MYFPSISLCCVVLQIWSKNIKMKSINLTALKKHGKVYEDGEFCYGHFFFLGLLGMLPPWHICWCSSHCVFNLQSSLAAWSGHTQRRTCCMWRRKRDQRLNHSSRSVFLPACVDGMSVPSMDLPSSVISSHYGRLAFPPMFGMY